MPEDTPTLRERAYFLQGQIKVNRERAALTGASIDSLIAALEAIYGQIEADEDELRSLRSAHYSEMGEEAKDQAQGRADEFGGSAA